MPAADFLAADNGGDLYALFDAYDAGGVLKNATEVTQWNDLSGNGFDMTPVGSAPLIASPDPFPNTTGTGTLCTTTSLRRHRFSNASSPTLEDFTLYYWGAYATALGVNQSEITINGGTSSRFGLVRGSGGMTRQLRAKRVGSPSWSNVGPVISGVPNSYSGNSNAFVCWAITRSYDPGGSTWRLVGMTSDGASDCVTFDITFTDDPGEITDDITQVGMSNFGEGGPKGGGALYLTRHSDTLINQLLVAAAANRGGVPLACAQEAFATGLPTTDQLCDAMGKFIPPDRVEPAKPYLCAHAVMHRDVRISALNTFTEVEPATASGIWLDLVARNFGTERAEGETDPRLRERLLSVGSGVVKQDILDAVNVIMTDAGLPTATIEEWFEGNHFMDDPNEPAGLFADNDRLPIPNGFTVILDASTPAEICGEVGKVVDQKRAAGTRFQIILV